MNLVINKIRNKDCFEGMSEMEDNSVNHVFTSPPYNRKRNDKYSNYDDTLTDYKGFLNKCLDECLRISKDFVFFNIQKNYYNKKEVFQIIGEYSNKIIDIIIWNKSNPMPGPGSTVANAYEFIIVLSKKHTSLKANKTYTKNSFQTNVYSNNKYTKIHKALMHPGACEYIVENFMKEGELVLDPFMGLGTTAMTCLKNKIDYVGFELSEEYCRLAEERIKDFVGENQLLLF